MLRSYALYLLKPGGIRYHPLFAASRKEAAKQAAEAELKQREADREFEAQRQAEAIAREEERWVLGDRVGYAAKNAFEFAQGCTIDFRRSLFFIFSKRKGS